MQHQRGRKELRYWFGVTSQKKEEDDEYEEEKEKEEEEEAEEEEDEEESRRRRSSPVFLTQAEDTQQPVLSRLRITTLIAL
ncbi:hypothetical protein Efla_001849 [Eimeria flavescens]